MSTLFWVGVGSISAAFAGILLVAWLDLRRKSFALLLLFAAMNLGFVVVATQVRTFPWVKLGLVALFAAAALRSIALAMRTWREKADASS